MLPNWLYGKSLRKLQEILNSGGQTAAGISYSNTESGLEATNAQTAIDEVVEGLNTKVDWDDLSEVGAVNQLLIKTSGDTILSNGVYGTYNSDNTITLHGTATDNLITFVEEFKTFKAGTYKLSGAPSMGSSDSLVSLTMRTSSNTTYGGARNDTDGVVFTLPTDTALKLVIFVKKGTNVEGKVVKPMLTPASYNGPYVPPAKTNKELTDELTVGALSATANTDYLNGTNNAIFRKYGKMVSCEGYFQVTTSAAKDAVLYTLAESPLDSSYLLALKNTGVYVLLNVKSDGTITVESGDGIATGFYSLIGTFVLP